MIFYYIRHGDPIYEPNLLTPLGRRQAEAVGKRLSVYGLDKIYSSPSNRARQTAQPICEMLKKEPIILDWTDEDIAWSELVVKTEQGEISWCFHYKPSRDIFVSAEVRALGKRFYEHPAFKKEMFRVSKFEEGLNRIQKNTDELFASLGYRHDEEKGGFMAEKPTNERVALFAHQGFGLAFLSCILDIPYNDISTKFDFSHSSMTVIEFAAKEGELCVPTVLQLSNDSHIYHEGMGTKYQNRLYI